MIIKIKKNRFFFVKKDQKPVVIFFHGFGLEPKFYKPILKKLAKEFTLIAPYLCDSDNFQNTFKIIEYMIKKYNLKNIILIGHSMGASLAIRFSLNFKEKINKIILLNGLILKENFNLVGLKITFDFIMIPFLENIKLAIKSFFTIFKNLLLKPKNFIYQLRYCFSVDLEKELGEVKSKVLILGSDQDRLISKKNLIRVSKKIKNCEIKFFKGNHLWFMSDPRGYLFIKKFIYEN